MYDPHAKALNPFLLSSNTFVAAEHAQRELVDPRLQHGAKLLLEVGGLALRHVITIAITISLGVSVGVQEAIGIRCVVVVMSLDKGEERLAHVAPLVCLWGGGWRWGCPLGPSSPSGEAETAPVAVPGRLRLVTWAFTFLAL